jgi:MYXO-CTERM domain-containing protein
MRPRRIAITAAAAAAAAILACAASARATPNFPPELQAHLMTGCSSPPPCTICHQTLNGGTGTAVKPFANTLKGFGLLKYQTNTLDSALDSDVMHNISSAGDGVPDVTKLKSPLCEDPNTRSASSDAGTDGAPVSKGDTTPQLAYGCGAQVANGGLGAEHAGAAAVAILGLALVGRRRRRR